MRNSWRYWQNSVCCEWDEISCVNHTENLKYEDWENPYPIWWIIYSKTETEQIIIIGKWSLIYLHKGTLILSCRNYCGLIMYNISLHFFFKELLLKKIIGGINLLFIQTILCSFSVAFFVCLFNCKDHLHENGILRLELFLILFPRYIE